MVDLTFHSALHAHRPRAGFVVGLAGLLATWRRRTRERTELAQLDHRVLRDLGISASEIAYEANKPFWRD